jgi:hypothetical protein
MSPGSDDLAKVPILLRRLYEIVNELETLFPGRSFTPDGHLVGSIGESLAAYIFDLELMVASNTAFDARTGDGLTVEIKATQGASVALSGSANPRPDRLVVLFLPRTGLGEIVYNGPAAQAWDLAGPIQKNGQRRIALSALRRLVVEDHHA